MKRSGGHEWFGVEFRQARLGTRAQGSLSRCVFGMMDGSRKPALFGERSNDRGSSRVGLVPVGHATLSW
jgi:hypothetical protein